MRSVVVLPAVAAVALLLAGCAAPAPTPTTSAPSETPEPTTIAGPLDCDALVPADVVAAAMSPAGDGTPQPEAAIQGNAALGAIELAAAGGLGCSWRIGPAPSDILGGSGEVAYLSVEVLPGAAGQWQPAWFGDSPSTDTVEVAGVTASRGAGETGWELTAPVGEAWVTIRLTAPGLVTGGSVYGEYDAEQMNGRLVSVGEAAFPVLAGASAEQLDWPRAAGQRQSDAVCTGGLDPQGIGMALGAASIEASAVDPTSSAPTRFRDAVAAASRAYRCEYTVDGIPGPTIDAVIGAGEQFELMSEADLSGVYEPLDLSGSPSFADGDAAFVVRVSDGPATTVLLKAGDSVYRVQSHDAPAAIAEAVLEQIR